MSTVIAGEWWRREQKAGAGALSDWRRKCRTLIGEIRGVTFKRLVEMLVDLVLLYGVDVWGCTKQLRPVEKCPDESSKDPRRSRETAPIGLPAI